MSHSSDAKPGGPALPIAWTIGDFEMYQAGTVVRESDKTYYDVPLEKPWDIRAFDDESDFRERQIIDAHTILLGKGNVPDLVAAQERMGIGRSVITVVGDRFALELGDLTRGEEVMDAALAAITLHPDRFIAFGNIDFQGFTDSSWADRQRRRFDRLWEKGVRGIKGHMGQQAVIRGFNAMLGLPEHHSFLTDPKVQTIWKHVGEKGGVVFEHLGDAPFNLKWYPHDKLLAEYEEMIGSNPDTLFVSPHLGSSVDDMGRLNRWLDTYPNLHVTVSGLITVFRLTTAFTEEGAQSFRRFLIDREDRVIFGSDAGMGRRRNIEAIYYIYRRWLEDAVGKSFGIFFDETRRVHALGLPEEVLEKLYYSNLMRLLPDWSS